MNEITNLQDLTNEDSKALPNPFDITSRSLDEQGNFLEGLEKETENDNQRGEPNFPLFFHFVYHDIDKDISPKCRYLIHLAYIGANLISSNFLVSFLSSFSVLSFSKFPVSPYQHIIMSFINALVIIPGIYFIQYYPLYLTFKESNSNRAFIYIQILLLILHVIFLFGPSGTGLMGILYCIISLKSSDSLFIHSLTVVLTIWHLVDFILEGILLILLIPFLKGLNYHGRYKTTSDIQNI